MTIYDFIKIDDFEVEVIDIPLSDENQRVYRDYVRFINSHFRPSFFTKRIYKHLNMHMSFIAHYNIEGFYSEYFETSAKFHKLAYGTERKPSEYGCFVGLGKKGKKNTQTKMAFFAIFEELKEMGEFSGGLGDFYRTITQIAMPNSELNKAIIHSTRSYLELWVDEVLNAHERKKQHIRDEVVSVKRVINQERSAPRQTAMFDFMDAA